VDLTATADPGSVFVGWGAPCDSAATTCLVDTYANQTVTAYFSVPSPDKALANQTPLKDSINGPVSEGTWNYYYADVGSGVGELVVDVIDLNGAVNLFVRNGAKPTHLVVDVNGYFQ
jgi:hypothetical protein